MDLITKKFLCLSLEDALKAEPLSKYHWLGKDLYNTWIKKQTEIQTLILSKERFKTRADARKWVLDNGFSAKKIDETSTSEAVSGPEYQTVVITLSGTGKYPNSAAFLRSINDELHDVSVVGFQLSGNPDSASVLTKFHFELVWYAAPISNTVAK